MLYLFLARFVKMREGYTFSPMIHWTQIYVGGYQEQGWRESVLFGPS